MKALHYTSNAAAKLITSMPPEVLKTAHTLVGKIALPLIRSTRSHMLGWVEDLKSIESLLETFQHEPEVHANPTHHRAHHKSTDTGVKGNHRRSGSSSRKRSS